MAYDERTPGQTRGRHISVGPDRGRPALPLLPVLQTIGSATDTTGVAQPADLLKFVKMELSQLLKAISGLAKRGLVKIHGDGAVSLTKAGRAELRYNGPPTTIPATRAGQA